MAIVPISDAFMSRRSIRIGTRGSLLALVQANHIKDRLESVDDTGVECELVVIKTEGDQSTQPISELGGKSSFVGALEQALRANRIDIAVHSFKDITSTPHKDLVLTGFFQTERSTDAVILFNNKCIDTVPTTIATGSMRRQALSKYWYPNMTCVPIRGNIDTRIIRAKEAGYDGLMLSTAGLQRLGREGEISQELDPTSFIPAPGQGMVAVQQRHDDDDLRDRVASLMSPSVHALGTLYWQLLQGISFNCQKPLGAYVSGDILHVFLDHHRPMFFQCPKTDVAVAIDALVRYGCA